MPPYIYDLAVDLAPYGLLATLLIDLFWRVWDRATIHGLRWDLAKLAERVEAAEGLAQEAHEKARAAR